MYVETRIGARNMRFVWCKILDVLKITIFKIGVCSKKLDRFKSQIFFFRSTTFKRLRVLSSYLHVVEELFSIGLPISLVARSLQAIVKRTLKTLNFNHLLGAAESTTFTYIQSKTQCVTDDQTKLIFHTN